MRGAAARTLELVVEKLAKEIRPLPEGGADREQERAPNRRLRAFLREFGARLCYWGQPRPPSTLLWLSVSLRIPIPPATLARSRFLSFSLPLSALPLRTPRPANFTPTRAPSVTILPYFPCTLRRSSFFRLRYRSPLLSPSPSLSLETLLFLLPPPDGLPIPSLSLLLRIPSTHFLSRFVPFALTKLHYDTFSPVSSFIPLILSRLTLMSLTTHRVIPPFASLSLLRYLSFSFSLAFPVRRLSLSHSRVQPLASHPACEITTDTDRRLAPARAPRFKTAVRRGRRR